MIDKTAEFLDTIENLEDYVDRFAGEDIRRLMKAIEGDFNKCSEIQESDYFQGYIFNWWDAYDFLDYLHSRFGVAYYEEVTVYLGTRGRRFITSLKVTYKLREG